MKRVLSLLVIVVVLFTLASCGGLRNTNRIFAKNMITDENLSINIHVKQSPALGNWTHFAVEYDIYELSEIISEQNNVEYSEVFDDKFILIKAEDKSPFLIKEIDKIETDAENDRRYAFFAPTIRLGETDIFLPYHLIENPPVQYYPGYSGPGVLSEYTSGTIFGLENYDFEDLYEFYADIDIYSVEYKDNDGEDIISVSESIDGEWTPVFELWSSAIGADFAVVVGGKTFSGSFCEMFSNEN